MATPVGVFCYSSACGEVREPGTTLTGETPMRINTSALPRWTWLLFSALAGTIVAFAILAVREFQENTGKMIGRKTASLALDDQERYWNKGDLDGFMVHYWKSEELLFSSGGDVTKGWQATYDRYQKKYKADGKEMGQLKFTIDDPEAVGPEAVVVRGKWALAKSDGSNPHGLFTLLFRRIDGEWKIVSDHTSAAETK